ncbi:hypothetical protein ABW19_dt0203838 [Dactylella cylindrospora]|nr:hypothetical protein ABW19_dt0203838 [Dactylella cylindrospora]
MIRFQPISRCSLASFRISYINRPHRQRVIGFPPSLPCCTTTIMAGRRKRARTQTEEDPAAHDGGQPTSTTTLPAATRRSQRTKLNNTSASLSAVAESKAGPKAEPEVAGATTLGEADEDNKSKNNNKKTLKKAQPATAKDRPKAKPKPVKLEKDSEDDEIETKKKGSSSTSKKTIKKESKEEEKEETENPYLARNTSGFWLMKSEPDAFSYDDLCKHDGPAGWDGVRNHVAKVCLAYHHHALLEAPSPSQKLLHLFSKKITLQSDIAISEPFWPRNRPLSPCGLLARLYPFSRDCKKRIKLKKKQLWIFY